MPIPNCLYEMLEEICESKKNEPALLYKIRKHYHKLSYEQFKNRIDKTACLFNQFGLQKGDRVILMSENRPEWLICDMGIMLAGGVSVPLDITLSESLIQDYINLTEARIVIVSSRKLLRKIWSIRKNLKFLKNIWVLDPLLIKKSRQIEIQCMDQLLAPLKTNTRMIQILKKNLEKNELCSIVFTSGTSNNPKGVMLSHRNLISNILDAFEISHFNKYHKALSILPLSHCYERVSEYTLLFHGISVAYPESVNSFLKNVKEVKPDIILGVPRFFEKIYQKINEIIRSQPYLIKKIIQYCLQFETDENPLKLILRKILVIRPLRKILGGNLNNFFSGGAPLSSQIVESFQKLGFPIYEGYGLTKASPIVSINNHEISQLGTVGKKLPSIEIKLSSDHELLVKGPNVMLGYYKNPKATAEAIDKEGWLHTGDLAQIDSSRVIRIIGRKKDLMALSNGKKIIPTKIESEITGHPLFKQVLVIAEKKKFVSALIVPDWAHIKSQFSDLFPLPMKFSFDRSDLPELYDWMQKILSKTMKNLSEAEKIKRFLIVREDFSVENGFLTTSFKLKRKQIQESFKTAIEEIYHESISAA